MNAVLEYNEETDEHFITIPESVLKSIGWEIGDMIDYDLDDQVLRMFKI